MPKCKDCRWVQRDSVDPRKGICTVEREKLGETQKTSIAIKAKTINMQDEACERFEKPGERREKIREMI